MLAARAFFEAKTQGPEALNAAELVVDPKTRRAATRISVIVCPDHLLQVSQGRLIAAVGPALELLRLPNPPVAGEFPEEPRRLPDGSDVLGGGAASRLAPPLPSVPTRPPDLVAFLLPKVVPFGVADGLDAVSTEMAIGSQIGLQILQGPLRPSAFLVLNGRRSLPGPVQAVEVLASREVRGVRRQTVASLAVLEGVALVRPVEVKGLGP